MKTKHTPGVTYDPIRSPRLYTRDDGGIVSIYTNEGSEFARIPNSNGEFKLSTEDRFARANEITVRWNAHAAFLSLAERASNLSCGCLGVAPVCVRCEARAALALARGES